MKQIQMRMSKMSVTPVETGVQKASTFLDSRFRVNDKLRRLHNLLIGHCKEPKATW